MTAHLRRICGVRPTGRLHLGHYFSVIKPAKEFDCHVLIARYHAPSIHEMEVLRFGGNLSHTFSIGIISQVYTFKPEFYFRLLELARIGDLQRMTQFKSAIERNAHLFTYPVLMAHDVADYDEVYVGDDQAQHVEFARDLLARYNAVYEPVTIPVARIIGGRIMDLKNPVIKMSKSKPETCVFLDDEPDVIRGKFRKAATTRDGIANLGVLYREFVGGEFPKDNCKRGKEKLAKAIIKRFVNPTNQEKKG